MRRGDPLFQPQMKTTTVPDPMNSSINDISAPTRGSILANRHGFPGYKFLAISTLCGAMWFGVPAIFARYPGRAVIGDNLYAQHPISRGQCGTFAAVLVIIAIGLYYGGTIAHRRRRDEWDAYRTHVRNREKELRIQENKLRNTFPAVCHVLSHKFAQKLSSDNGNYSVAELTNRLESALRCRLQLLPNCTLEFDHPRLAAIVFQANLFCRDLKSDSGRIDLSASSTVLGLSLQLNMSIASNVPDDPASYPMFVTPMRTSPSAVEVLVTSANSQSSTARSPDGVTHTESYGTSTTPQFRSQDFSNNEGTFNIWKAHHPSAYSMLDSAWEICKAEIEGYFKSPESTRQNTNGI